MVRKFVWREKVGRLCRRGRLVPPPDAGGRFISGCLPGSVGFGPALRNDQMIGHQGALFRRVIKRANGFSSKPSGGFFERVMIQEAAQVLLALHLGRERRLGRVIKAQRNDIGNTLMRTTGIVMCLDREQRPA